jgi:hypothetical protein
MFILSCRHEVADLDHAYNVMTQAHDREGNPAVSYETVCGACEDRYRQRGILFDTQEQAWAWVKENTDE